MRVPYYPPRQWRDGGQIYNPGVPGPRSNLEVQALDPRIWPAAYQVPARGLGAMPAYQIGITIPIQNNQYAGGSTVYNTVIPGLAKSPFG